MDNVLEIKNFKHQMTNSKQYSNSNFQLPKLLFAADMGN